MFIEGRSIEFWFHECVLTVGFSDWDDWPWLSTQKYLESPWKQTSGHVCERVFNIRFIEAERVTLNTNPTILQSGVLDLIRKNYAEHFSFLYLLSMDAMDYYLLSFPSLSAKPWNWEQKETLTLFYQVCCQDNEESHYYSEKVSVMVWTHLISRFLFEASSLFTLW